MSLSIVITLSPLLEAIPTVDSQADEFGSPIVLFLFIAVVLGTVAIASALVGFIGAITITALILIASFLAITAIVHFIIALVIWTQKPDRMVWMHKRWWALAALPLGGFTGALFYWLHYRRQESRSCLNCGFVHVDDPHPCMCPECIAHRRTDQ